MTKHQTVKIFDRRVDLNQFEPNSSLYKLCRAWVNGNHCFNVTSQQKVTEETTPTKISKSTKKVEISLEEKQSKLEQTINHIKIRLAQLPD